jgi:gamma-glutamyltranspeptidase/glutathione hydrolase
MEMADRINSVCMLMVLAFAVTTACGIPDEETIAPIAWDEAELEKYLDAAAGPAYHSVSQVELAGEHGAITGTSGIMATQIGLETLERGGSAVDAMIATSLAQIALTAGSAISYAGIMTMVHYDAATGEITSMNAGYNTVQSEDDPMSIPGMNLEELGADGNLMEALDRIEPSGRTALVPGFMAGAQAAHDRYGKVPWASLFAPTIFIAERGIPVGAYLEAVFGANQRVLSRLPETKAVFTREDGEFYQAGDTFRQPALAQTLRTIAAEGADYMYTGPWAERFVAAVQADGGKMTLRDMADYEVIWSEPLPGAYKGFGVHAYNLPASGGVHTVEALNVLELAELGRFAPRYWESAQAVKWMADIFRLSALSYLTDEELGEQFPGMDLSLASRANRDTALATWKKIESSNGAFPPGPTADEASSDDGPKHSAAVVAVDRWGNMAAVVHSINTVGWGKTGIMVDGISIPDSAWFQQKQIFRAGPGTRLPDPTNPCIITKDGKLFLGSSSIGSSLHLQTIQGLYNVLEYGMRPNDAVASPAFMMGGWDGAGISAVETEFDAAIIEEVEKLGVRVQAAPTRPRFWIAVMIDPETGERITTDSALPDDAGNMKPMGLAAAY